VPVRSEVAYELTNDEELELRFCDTSFGWRNVSSLGSSSRGTVKDSSVSSTPRTAVRAAGVDGQLRLYGVFFTDADHDDSRFTCDCNDGDATLWDKPVMGDTLLLSRNQTTGVTTLTWTVPTFTGGTATLRYDTVRSTSCSTFVTGATCVEGDGSDLTSTDSINPSVGQVFYYIIVPQNSCPSHATCFIPDPRTPARECTGS
jgi:hypothetical protein